MKKIFTLLFALVMGAITSETFAQFYINGRRIMEGVEYTKDDYDAGLQDYYWDKDAKVFYMNNCTEIRTVKGQSFTISFDGRNTLEQVEADALTFEGNGFINFFTPANLPINENDLKDCVMARNVKFVKGCIAMENEAKNGVCVRTYGGAENGNLTVMNEAALQMKALNQMVVVTGKIVLGNSIKLNKPTFEIHDNGVGTQYFRDSENGLSNSAMLLNTTTAYADVNKKSIKADDLFEYYNTGKYIDANGVYLSFNPVTGKMRLRGSIDTDDDYAMTLRVNTVLSCTENVTIHGKEVGIVCTKGLTINAADEGVTTISGTNSYGVFSYGGTVKLGSNLAIEGGESAVYCVDGECVNTANYKGSIVYDKKKKGLCYHPLTALKGAVAKEVQTLSDNTVYPINIAGIPVHSGNCDDVLMDKGSIKYWPGNSMLVLTNAKVDCGDEVFIDYNGNHLNQLTAILTVGTNEVSTTSQFLKYEYRVIEHEEDPIVLIGGENCNLITDAPILFMTGTNAAVWGNIHIDTTAPTAISSLSDASTLSLGLMGEDDEIELRSETACIKGFKSLACDNLPAGVEYDTNNRKLMAYGKECTHLFFDATSGIQSITADALNQGVTKRLNRGQVVIENGAKRYNVAGARMQ